MKSFAAAAMVATIALFLTASVASAQGANRLDTLNQAGNGNTGIIFQVSAHAPITVYRVGIRASSTSSFTSSVQVWYRLGTYNGIAGNNWVHAGTASMTMDGTVRQVPVDINLTIYPNENYTFALISSGGSVGYTDWNNHGPYTDGNLSIHVQGWGGASNTSNTPPMTDQNFPRAYNGAIWYDLAGPDLTVLGGTATASTIVTPNDAGSTGDGVVIGDTTIRAGQDPWTVNSVTFTSQGSGDDSAAFSTLALYEDTNGNGSFDGSGTDALATAAAGTAFVSDNGEYTAALAYTGLPATSGGGPPATTKYRTRLARPAEGTGKLQHNYPSYRTLRLHLRRTTDSAAPFHARNCVTLRTNLQELARRRSR